MTIVFVTMKKSNSTNRYFYYDYTYILSILVEYLLPDCDKMLVYFYCIDIIFLILILLFLIYNHLMVGTTSYSLAKEY